jgi:hypothetical protein
MAVTVLVASCPGPGDGSETDPYCSIQTAIDNAAMEGDEIVVVPGTYFETIDFLGKAVWLHSSDGAQVTVIDAGGGYGSVVKCVSGEGADSVLEGFTITGGTGIDACGPGVFCSLGGGMYNVASSPTVKNCIFSGNSATSLDGGSGGGMYNGWGASPTVTGCTFRGNFATFGGGIASHYANSSPTVVDCVFSGNGSYGGGGAVDGGSGRPPITNCLFIGNWAAMWGGFDAYGGAMSGGAAINCTFIGNTVVGVGGGGAMAYGMAINCIFQDNSPDQVVDVMATYSNVEGGWSGTGNIDADPMFVQPLEPPMDCCLPHLEGGCADPSCEAIVCDIAPRCCEYEWDSYCAYLAVTGCGDSCPSPPANLRLLPDSPCIDAGHNNAISELTDTDLDGNPRFADDPATDDTGCGVPVVVDIGAYEHQGVPAEVPLFADLNDDGVVTIVDLMMLNGCTGSDDPDCCLADLDADGVVGMSDRMLLFHRLYHAAP